MSNRFQPIPANTDPSQMAAAINNNFAQLDQEGVKKIYGGSDGVPRIFIDGTTGVIKVAPEGTDVTTADDSVLMFNSTQKNLKIVATGTLDVDANGVTAGVPKTTTFTHDLGYVPIPLVFFTPDGYYRQLPFGLKSTAAGNVVFTTWIECWTNTTQLGVDFIGGASGDYGSFTMRYYLLRESAN
jgi:hypothetical protein